MMMMDSVVVHLGSIVHFQCRHHWSTDNTPITILSASVFKFHTHDNTFKRCQFLGSPSLQTEIKGSFEIIDACKVDCNITGVLQPCILLKTQFDATIPEFKFYQLQNLKKLIKLLSICGTADENCFSLNSNVHICDGPCLIIIDTNSQKILSCKASDEQLIPIWLQSDLKKTGNSIYAFQSFWKAENMICKFLSQALVSTSDHEHSSPIPNSTYKWISVEIELNYTHMQMKVFYQDETSLPDVYCSSATAVTLSDVSGFSHFITTSRSQLISIKNNKVENVCDIPFSKCSNIFVVGEQENQVALLINGPKKQCCFVHLATAEVLKVWDNVIYAVDGTFVIRENMTKGALILHSKLESNCLEQEDFSIISDLKDVVKVPRKRPKEFTLKSTNQPMDTECDLFSSPTCADDKLEETVVLSNVIKSLQLTVSSHRSVIDQLRSSLQHCEAVTSISRNALCEMNNNVDLHKIAMDTKTDLYRADMVDFFTLHPCPVEDNQSNEKTYERILALKKTWQRVICDEWIVGFDFINLSEKCFINFAVVLCNCCPSTSGDQHFVGSNFTRTFGSIDNINNLMGKPKRHVATIDYIKPKEGFTITAKFHLPSFTDIQANFLFSAAVVATVKQQSQKHVENGSCNEEILIFNVGKVCLTATDVFANASFINLKCFDDSKTNKATEDLKAIQACHTHEKQLDLSSDRTDVLAACQELLGSVGFTWIEHLSFFVCTKIGPLYLVLIKLHQHSKTAVTLQISSKSEFEASFLTRYFNEQIVSDLIVVDST